MDTNRLLAIALFLTGCYADNPLNPDAPHEADIAGEYVVGLRAGGDLDAAQRLADDHGLELADFQPGAALALLVDPDLRGRDAVLQGLSPEVEFAEPQIRYELLRRPDDLADYLWGLENYGGNGGREDADIDAEAAWDRSTGAGVVVAVIDTGITVDHPDLRPNLWVNHGEVAGNGLDDDGNGYVDDVHGYDFVHRDGDPRDRLGHGTHVAGTVAARGDDGFGVPGVAFDARIMAIQLMDSDGGGSSWQAAEAIRYAVDNGADVINASWGSYGYSNAVRSAIAAARQRGVMFVAAAGNEGRDNDSTPLYPASYNLDNILSVAASDRRDRVASFSNVGASKVDLAAPGVDIVSTWTMDQQWTWQDGTSMASPHVAGAIALLLGADPTLSVDELRSAILGSVDPLASGASLVATGGRLNAAAALDRILGPAGNSGQGPEEPVDLPETPAEPTLGDWTFVAFPVATAHPYGNDFNGSIGIDPPAGASQIQLHFDRIDVEANYDFVEIRSEAGAVLQRFTGDVGAAVSQEFAQPSVELWFTSDGSVTGWGMALSGFSWR